MAKLRRHKMMPQMMTVKNVCEFLNVSRSSVHRWSNNGMLKCYQLGTRGDRRYTMEDIYAFLERFGNIEDMESSMLPGKIDCEMDLQVVENSRVSPTGVETYGGRVA